MSKIDASTFEQALFTTKFCKIAKSKGLLIAHGVRDSTRLDLDGSDMHILQMREEEGMGLKRWESIEEGGKSRSSSLSIHISARAKWNPHLHSKYFLFAARRERQAE